MTLVRDIVTVCAILAGIFFFVAGTTGLLRFPDTLTRLHPLTKVDSLALGFIVLGLMTQAGTLLQALKLVVVWLLAVLAGATVSQLIARASDPAPPLS